MTDLQFAVIENDIVVNTILAPSLEVAKFVTNGKECVEYTIDNPAIIGLGYKDGIFEQPPIVEYIPEWDGEEEPPAPEEPAN